MLPTSIQVFPAKLKDQITLCASVLELPVQWSQQDMIKHLNNSWWAQFGESGLVDLLSRLQWHLQETPINFTGPLGNNSPLKIKTIELQYKAQAAYPEKIIVATKPIMIEKDKVIIKVECYSIKLKRVACLIHYNLVSSDEKVPELSTDLIDALHELIKKPQLFQEVDLTNALKSKL